jgi:hypothetical protein
MAKSKFIKTVKSNVVVKEVPMTNEVNPAISTLESEGVALATMWKAMVLAEAKRFSDFTKAEGFDTRLGKLMQELKAEGGERISGDRLKACGIHTIDKRRRAEALWFVENEVACREFIKASKKGFTSLSALQKAMAISAKKDMAIADEVSDEPVADEVSEKAKSDVGPTITKEVVFDHLLKVCKANKINLLDLAEMLMSYDEVTIEEEAAKAA